MSLRVEVYEEDNHGKSLEQLLKLRSLPKGILQDLPVTSLVILKEGEDQMIAFGGVRYVEGKRGMLDSYITHPHADPKDRNEALDLLTEKLIFVMKSLGYLQLLAFSADINTQLRAKRHGFINLPENLFQILNLSAL